jgi:acetyl-CoA carboxylase carboxyl transferase subunit beta
MGWDGLRRFVFHRKSEVPDDLWTKCEYCKDLIYKKDIEERIEICPKCNFHFTLPSQKRLDLLLDEGYFEEYWTDLLSSDPLKFKAVVSYKEKIIEAQKETNLKDAILIGKGKIEGMDVIIGITDSRFIMGSMGSVVGEKVARAAEKAIELKIPLILISGSGGGARMYEGCLSLMQMAKTSAAIARLHQAGGLYISILTNPTMAGVMASFAALGDITIAEPKALIGFTGPRVIAQTIGKQLPDGFQTSEFLLEHGFIDMIIDRTHMKKELSRIIKYCTIRA